MSIIHPISTITRPVFDRSYKPLHRLSWPWRILATWASLAAWLVSTPWLLIRLIAPHDMQHGLGDIEQGFLSFFRPIANLVQDLSFKAFEFVDFIVHWTINNIMHIVWGAVHMFERLLRDVEHRVRILKTDGLHGISHALSFTA